MNRAAPLLSVAFFLAACRAPRPTVAAAHDRGWEALVVRSRAAEAVIVPAIGGRVMQLAPVGGRGDAGPFDLVAATPACTPSGVQDDRTRAARLTFRYQEIRPVCRRVVLSAVSKSL